MAVSHCPYFAHHTGHTGRNLVG